MAIQFYRYSLERARTDNDMDLYNESQYENRRCRDYIQDEETGFHANAYKDNFEIPEDYTRKQTLTNCERYITQELKEMESTIFSADEKLVSHTIMTEESPQILKSGLQNSMPGSKMMRN